MRSIQTHFRSERKFYFLYFILCEREHLVKHKEEENWQIKIRTHPTDLDEKI